MPSAPRAVVDAYGPYVRACQKMRFDRTPVDVRDLGCWSLWLAEEGALELEVAESLRQYSPAAVLLPPLGVRLRIGSGSWYWRCTFDALHRSRRATTGGTVRVADPVPPDPAGVTLWGQAPPVLVPDEMIDRLRVDLSHIESQWWRGGLDYLDANNRLGRFLIDLLRHDLRKTVNRFDQLEALVSDRIDQGLNVASVARLAGCSRQHLDRLVRAERGVSPGVWLRQLRWARVDRLQRAGFDDRGIAAHCGFGSVAAFRAALNRRTRKSS